MLALAAILCAFAAVTAGFLRVPDRWLKDRHPSPAVLRVLDALLPLGLLASLSLAIADKGIASGIGLWCAAVMVSGVASVSLASSYPRLALRAGCAAVAIAIPLAAAQVWAGQ